jgi:methionyl-tRNA synthetase
MECADIANKYIDEKAPWALVKEDEDAARVVCTVALNAFRILMIYLAPVLPELTKKLASFLNLSNQNWSELDSYIQDISINPYEHVLKRLILEDVNKLLFDA